MQLNSSENRNRKLALEISQKVSLTVETSLPEIFGQEDAFQGCWKNS